MTALTVIRGDTATFNIALTDSVGAPLDLTGLDLTFTAKENLLDTDLEAVITKTIGSGITVDADPTTGLAVLTILPDDTTGLPDAYRLVWDIQVDDGAGDTRTPLSGRFVVIGDVTRGLAT